MRVRAAAFALLLTAVGLPARWSTAAPATPPQCSQVVASPSFGSDHIAFCAGETGDRDHTPQFALSVTKDGGKSWSTARALGIVSNAQDCCPILDAMMISPLFATD